MSSDWISGAFGLAGVIVGGSITSGASWIGDRRRTNLEARTAAQLLRRQLQTTARSVSQAIKTKSWGPTRSLDTSSWDEHQAAFASALKPSEWIVVASAIEYIRNQTAPMVELHAPNWRKEVVAVTDDFLTTLEPLWEDCRVAFVALHRASKAPDQYRDLGPLPAPYRMNPEPLATPSRPHRHSVARGPIIALKLRAWLSRH